MGMDRGCICVTKSGIMVALSLRVRTQLDVKSSEGGGGGGEGGMFVYRTFVLTHASLPPTFSLSLFPRLLLLPHVSALQLYFTLQITLAFSFLCFLML